ncbi:hypothetical protein BK709_24310 [Bacillus thuringiensis serovar shandongiensis]|nr:hypothetical protein ACS75_17100 [Bacillus thuringiensis]OUB03160.1 hypothetical protein BK709_24310 [Bacillus thuringiensis serovar shandongiensis]
MEYHNKITFRRCTFLEDNEVELDCDGEEITIIDRFLVAMKSQGQTLYYHYNPRYDDRSK